MLALLCLIAASIAAAEKKSRYGQPQPAATAPVSGFELMDVMVTSVPPGARIEVERIPAGQTPAIAKLQPGEYQLKLALGLNIWEQKITVRSGQVNTLTIVLRPKAPPAEMPRNVPSQPSAPPPAVPAPATAPAALSPAPPPQIAETSPQGSAPTMATSPDNRIRWARRWLDRSNGRPSGQTLGQAPSHTSNQALAS